MKAKVVNGKIEFGLPKYYKHWAGGFNELSDDIHEKEGFYHITHPDFDHKTQRISDIYFDEKNNVFTYDIIDLELDLETERTKKVQEIEAKINNEKSILLDAKIIEMVVMGEPIPQSVKDRIIVLRAKQVEAITAIGNMIDSKSVVKFSLSIDDTVKEVEIVKEVR